MKKPNKGIALLNAMAEAELGQLPRRTGNRDITQRQLVERLNTNGFGVGGAAEYGDARPWWLDKEGKPISIRYQLDEGATYNWCSRREYLAFAIAERRRLDPAGEGGV